MKHSNYLIVFCSVLLLASNAKAQQTSTPSVAYPEPQVYGTQAKGKWKGKEPVFHPIEDAANVDRRRAEVGLPPMADYVRRWKQMYFPKDK